MEALPTDLVTPRLRLRPFTAADCAAAQRGDAALAHHLGTPVALGWLEFPVALTYWHQLLRADAQLGPWLSYGWYDGTTHELIGSGGFKGRPAAGVVEVGYGLAPTARGRGLATEGVAALVAWAYAQAEGPVREVIAHTLATENPSVAVLRRAGFARVAELTDPDDGPLWRWRHQRPTSAAQLPPSLPA